MAEIINLFEKPKPERFCSFCKRKEREVKKLFTNNVEGDLCRNICDSCVILAKQKLDQNDQKGD